jgi:glutamate 5-kinase
MSEALRQARRIVVKVGSSLVTNEGRGVDAEAIGNWCRQMAALAHQGLEVVMVSSGAIAEGMKRLGWTSRPTELSSCRPPRPWGRWAWPRCTRASCRAMAWAARRCCSPTPTWPTASAISTPAPPC